MVDKRAFEEMIVVYEKAIPEMGWLEEFDWCNAACETLKRIIIHLHQGLNEFSIQLARECHADLQGYIAVKYGSNILDAESCGDGDCFDLYLLGQRLVQIGDKPTDYIRSWITLTKAITRDFDMKFIPRINFKVKVPLRVMMKEILGQPDSHDWKNIVQSIWQLDESGKWQLLYSE